MNTKWLLGVALSCLAAGSAYALSQITSGVIAAGGSSASSATALVTATVGQPAVGPATGASSSVTAGFWTTVSGTVVGAPEAPAPLPSTVSLGRAHPNPSRGATGLTLALPEPTEVHVAIHDLAGRSVRALDSGVRPAGHYEIRWDGRDERGRPSANGVYFFRVQAGEKTFQRKVIFLR